MAVVELRKCLIILIVFYCLSAVFGFLASVPMILHVYPQSECLLFSNEYNQKLYYGSYVRKFENTVMSNPRQKAHVLRPRFSDCNIVAYVFLFVIVGALYLIFKAWSELRELKGHHPQGYS